MIAADAYEAKKKQKNRHTKHYRNGEILCAHNLPELTYEAFSASLFRLCFCCDKTRSKRLPPTPTSSKKKQKKTDTVSSVGPVDAGVTADVREPGDFFHIKRKV